MKEGGIDARSDGHVKGEEGADENDDSEGIDPEFRKGLRVVRRLIAELRSNNQRIGQLKQQYAKAIKSSNEKENSEKMEQILAVNWEIYTELKKYLEKLNKAASEAEEKNPTEPETQMMRNLYMGANQEASEALTEQREYESDFKEIMRDKVTRQVRSVDPNVSDEQLEEFSKNPDLAQKLLHEKIYGKASTGLLNVVSDIEDKFRDIQLLEQNVAKCLKLFEELSLLVMRQGEKIDSIAAHIQGTKDYVTRGEEQLKKGKEHHKCSRKCMCILIVVSLVALLVVIIIIVAATAKK